MQGAITELFAGVPGKEVLWEIAERLWLRGTTEVKCWTLFNPLLRHPANVSCGFLFGFDPRSLPSQREGVAPGCAVGLAHRGVGVGRAVDQAQAYAEKLGPPYAIAEDQRV
jgi:hypothetical protein